MAGLEEIRVKSRGDEDEEPAQMTGEESSASTRKNKREGKRRNSRRGSEVSDHYDGRCDPFVPPAYRDNVPSYVARA